MRTRIFVLVLFSIVVNISFASNSYNYDSLNRLTSATIDGSYVEYEYDKAGNILAVNTPYSISSSILGAGTVTDNRDKLNCGMECDGVYENNTSVTLTATPEADSSFVEWSGDCSGSSTCTINVTAQYNVTATFSVAGNNPPEFTDFGPFDIDENSPNGSFVGDVNANDGDGGNDDAGVTYSKAGGTGQWVFNVNSNSGVISVSDSAQLDYEANTGFILTVKVDDGVHETFQNITININDLAEGGNPPIIVDSGPFNIDENSPNGTFIGDVNANDGDGGANDDGVTYVFGGPGTCSGNQANNCDIMEIDINTGVISVKNSVLLDYESITSVSQGLIVSDNNSNSNTTVTIFINDVDESQLPEPPIFTSPVDGSVENNTTVQITGTGIPGAALTVVTDSSQTLCTVAIANNGQWNCSVNLSDGVYNIFAYQTVGVDTSTATSLNFTVFTSNSVKAPTIDYPADGEYLDLNTFTATGSMTTGFGIGLTIDVVTDDGIFVSEYCEGDRFGFGWFCEINLPDGSYDVRVYNHETLSGDKDRISSITKARVHLGIIFIDGFEQ